MLRMRPSGVLVFALSCAASLALSALIVAADSPAPAAPSVEDRVKVLEQRVQQLEQKLAAAQAPAPNPAAVQLESEAGAAYNEINKLALAGKAEEAKAQLPEFMKKYGTTSWAGRASMLQKDLELLGKQGPTNWGIQKWFQGQNDIDLAAKKTTLVVFWEVWCPHCQREVPKLQAMYTDLKGQGLQVVGLTKVTKTSTDDKVASFISEQKIGYPVAKEDGSASTYFNVGGIPAAVVLKDGKIVWRGHPASLTEDKLKGWL